MKFSVFLYVFGREQFSQKPIIEVYRQLDEEIYLIEMKCPEARLHAIDEWIKLMESESIAAQREIIQMPLHLIDNENIEEVELSYDQQQRISEDYHSVAKVRQVGNNDKEQNF